MHAEEVEKRSKKAVKEDPKAHKDEDETESFITEVEPYNASRTDANYETDTDSKAAYDV